MGHMILARTAGKRLALVVDVEQSLEGGTHPIANRLHRSGTDLQLMHCRARVACWTAFSRGKIVPASSPGAFPNWRLESRPRITYSTILWTVRRAPATRPVWCSQ